ncbi:MAG: hypothetical protein AAGF59_12415 [Pseudomonadota bacterium]
MTLSTNIYAEVTTTFPAAVEGGPGITIQKVGGVYTIAFDPSGIPINGVSLDKLATSATDRLIGRDSAGIGDLESLTVGGGLEFTGAGGIQRSALTGDVTAAAGNAATLIGANAVTFAKLQDLASDRLVGRDSEGTGDGEEISVGGGLEFTGLAGIRRAALTGDVAAPAGSDVTTISAGAVSYAKLQDVSTTERILARKSAASGPVEEASVSEVLDFLGSTAQGDIVFRGAMGWVNLGPGTAGQFLRTNGASADPEWATPTASATFPRGHLAGLQLANNATDGEHDIDISVGECRSEDNLENLSLMAALTKRIDAQWAVGDGNGGLDVGSVTADTWYHVFLIKRTDSGVVDALYSTSATSPTLPASYTRKRRIGSVLADGSGNIIAFIQNGDDFSWMVPVTDVNTAVLGTAAYLYTVSTPGGLKTKARIYATFYQASGAQGLLTEPDQTDTAPSTAIYTFSTAGGADTGQGMFELWTDTSSRFRARSSADSTQFLVTTLGWTDRRGKDD